MLVLSRKRNEKIVINHEITITVVEIRGDKVRLGIEAPLSVSIHRWEVEKEIERLGEVERQSKKEDDPPASGDGSGEAAA